MPRKSKYQAILDQLEENEGVDLDLLRAIGRKLALVLWLAVHSEDSEGVMDEAEQLVEMIAVYAVEP